MQSHALSTYEGDEHEGSRITWISCISEKYQIMQIPQLITEPIKRLLVSEKKIIPQTTGFKEQTSKSSFEPKRLCSTLLKSQP